MRNLFLTLLVLAATPLTAASDPLPPPPANLSPIAWSIGNWTCQETYFASPFTAAHTAEGVFHVATDVGNLWLSGDFHEVSSSNGQLVAIHEIFTVDATGSGIRSFSDSNFGRFFGGFVAGSTSTEFTGQYFINVPGLGPVVVGFTETLTRVVGDRSFSTESRVLLPLPDGTTVPVVFHRQTCTKLGSAPIASTQPDSDAFLVVRETETLRSRALCLKI